MRTALATICTQGSFLELGEVEDETVGEEVTEGEADAVGETEGEADAVGEAGAAG